jgi:hypothetical protein
VPGAPAHRAATGPRSAHRGRPLVLAAVLLVVACGDSGVRTADAAAETDSAGVGAPRPHPPRSPAEDGDPPRGGASSEPSIEVTVSGGRWAGTHHYRGEVECGFTPRFGTWTAAMSNRLPRTVSEMNLIAASLAPEGGQGAVGTFDMNFGQHGDPDEERFHASTEDGIGRGVHFDVARRDAGALIRGSGIDDATGVRFTAAVRCSSVETYR